MKFYLSVKVFIMKLTNCNIEGWIVSTPEKYVRVKGKKIEMTYIPEKAHRFNNSLAAMMVSQLCKNSKIKYFIFA